MTCSGVLCVPKSSLSHRNKAVEVSLKSAILVLMIAAIVGFFAWISLEDHAKRVAGTRREEVDGARGCVGSTGVENSMMLNVKRMIPEHPANAEDVISGVESHWSRVELGVLWVVMDEAVEDGLERERWLHPAAKSESANQLDHSGHRNPLAQETADLDDRDESLRHWDVVADLGARHSDEFIPPRAIGKRENEHHAPHGDRPPEV